MADALAQELGSDAGDMRKVIDALFGANGRGGSLRTPGLIHQWVAYGYEVEIPGFARFSRGKLNARKVKHPATGEEYTSQTRWRARAQVLAPFSRYVDTIVQAHRKPKADDDE